MSMLNSNNDTFTLTNMIPVANYESTLSYVIPKTEDNEDIFSDEYLFTNINNQDFHMSFGGTNSSVTTTTTTTTSTGSLNLTADISVVKEEKNHLPEESQNTTTSKGKKRRKNSASTNKSSSQSKPKKRRPISEKEQKAQREHANVRERQRTKDLNEAFNLLKELVPMLPPDKGSKIGTLKLALCYIQYLNNVLEDRETLSAPNGSVLNYDAPREFKEILSFNFRQMRINNQAQVEAAHTAAALASKSQDTNANVNQNHCENPLESSPKLSSRPQLSSLSSSSPSSSNEFHDADSLSEDSGVVLSQLYFDATNHHPTTTTTNNHHQ